MRLKMTAMSQISHTIQIAAAPESVFDAVSLQDQLARWWTNNAKAGAVLGSVAEFGFYNRTIVIKFRIEELEREANQVALH